MDYERLSTGDVSSCIDMSKIKQPLFSEWPPIKPTPSLLPFIPRNPFVDQDELFKVPEEVIKLTSSGIRRNLHSYKNQIKTFPRDKF